MIRTIKEGKQGNVTERECGGLPEIWCVLAMYCCITDNLHTTWLRKNDNLHFSPFFVLAGFSCMVSLFHIVRCSHSCEWVQLGDQFALPCPTWPLAFRLSTRASSFGILAQSSFGGYIPRRRVALLKFVSRLAQCHFYHSLLVKGSYQAIQIQRREVNATFWWMKQQRIQDSSTLSEGKWLCEHWL